MSVLSVQIDPNAAVVEEDTVAAIAEGAAETLTEEFHDASTTQGHHRTSSASMRREDY